MTEGLKQDVLYPLQEAVFGRLQTMGNIQFNEAKLCGGTALARCWLEHRVSYDLDFFLPHGFNSLAFSVSLKNAGFDYETSDIVDDYRKANQLHGYVLHEGQRLKVSFIEDAYFTIFPSIYKKLGNLVVKTEEIPGLYHRKLRTVSGNGSEGSSFEGGRQKARDLLDLHVLSVVFKPIRAFIASLPYAFPSDAFDNGLINMPWFDLMDELKEIVCDPQWNKAKDVDYLQASLFAQIGATLVTNDSEPKTALSVPDAAKSPKGRPTRNNGRSL